jgi:glycosyltransferase involved in cell wall biosynthesis
MERLRIGHFTWEAQYGLKVGGITPHITAVAEGLAARGHEVHVFTRRGNFPEYDLIRGVHYQRVPHDYGGSIVEQMDRMCRAMADRFFAVESLHGEFDVLHAHDWHPVLAMPGIKGRCPVPWVFTYHSTEWGRAGNLHPRDDIGREIARREWLGAYEAREVIVTSHNLWNEVRALYQVPEAKTHLVPNGATSLRREVDPARVRKGAGIPPAAPVVLFVGRMTYQKGPDLLLEAVPRVLAHRGDVRFVFAGAGDLQGPCEARARELGVAGACRFLGYVTDDQVADWMNACDLLAVPSRNEPFGIVALEAWSCGKPVIGTEAVDLIHNFVDGIRAYVQPESVAWCINQVIGKPEVMREMGERGRAKVEKEYNWERILDQTLAVYRRARGG